VLSLLKVLVIVGLLAVPLLVITELPKLFELAGSTPTAAGVKVTPAPTPGVRRNEPAPTSTRGRFAALDETPPPTLTRPAPAATPGASPASTSTGERIVIGNTGGLGAVLRAEPVTGRAVGALREKQVFEVLERRSVPGGGEWVRIRTPEGVEGWVTGIVALPATATAATR
jgi:Bacterial SH3 domain